MIKTLIGRGSGEKGFQCVTEPSVAGNDYRNIEPLWIYGLHRNGQNCRIRRQCTLHFIRLMRLSEYFMFP